MAKLLDEGEVQIYRGVDQNGDKGQITITRFLHEIFLKNILQLALFSYIETTKNGIKFVDVHLFL